MDARVMQDIDGYSSSCVNGPETFFDNSPDFTQQFAATNFWDTLDDSSTSSYLNSAAASVSRQTPSTTANSPASHTSAELPSKPSYQSHKHSIPGKSGPKKRRCSEESKTSRVIQDPSALDCSDYWLRFDSDNESLDQFLDYSSQDTKHVGPFCSASACGGEKGTDTSFSLNFAESFADAQVRSLSLSRHLSKTSTVGTTGDANKVALPPVTSDLIDDSALDQALSDEDDLFSMALVHELGPATTSAPAPPPPEPQERLYSTPLSWEQPRPGYHMNYVNTNMPIGDAERQRLLAIALGTGQAPTQQATRPPAVADFHFEMTQSPSDSTSNTPEPKPRTTTTRPAAPSRKNSSEGTERPKEKPKNSERAAHNDIERKYRTNLKDKIAELRDAIPSLRAIPEDDDPNSPAGSSRTAPKVSKGTVLTKATEYIHQLERRNRSVAQKNEELARRLQAFEQLVGAPPGSNWRPQGYGGPVYNQRF
ncbi:helix-loop-helix DNA-binding domain-containing protein [Xylaria bambusicola]|uniref:helix-loop-helix DNA-binding domain-containing protein n=1 Tax=Xylaria bambusicola TaxID=326684 RepID=UPI0020081C85|nr:helix-loop-helix DNA-binding domain-containing protein [Xylaria bambusicola]KAI0514942.1 helix-loop-helix DNA-binding domain-containing protein [Xylaria bambusicola]